ncbi:MAG: dephospho-CoA kinase [Bryobacteraceae bacterium]|nr:dephospho-CoA kinase [Bryobacteraceae bacterium]
MLRVGLTGGLASGKSFVGQALAELGCLWIQADELGHRVMAPGGEAYEAIVREFGGVILKEDGSIDRTALADLVFEDPERLEALNKLVHPPVIRQEEELLREFAAREPAGIAVVEAAILLEAGSRERFDRLVVAWCREDQQVERALRRPGATLERVMARLGRQMPLNEKAKLADFVIDTSGSKENTLEQVRRMHESLRRIAS